MNSVNALVNMVETAIENYTEMNVEMRLLNSDNFIVTHFIPLFVEVSGDNVCVYGDKHSISINLDSDIYYDEYEKGYVCSDGSVVITISI